ncbi:hypothetical protein [Halodesulfovibrio sp.]|jgi:hypothetical protein|uniref:hypothetical protein n=1 Tax=Halodesulfovibrio sp. TaxID=1912772 RepID=UPI0025E81553|nr:hypothetical protein [Halodesulfovibrio sp.]MCT4534237.1 hypothetical protein [Halodesulfovibrio sp.]MCT4625813.1 hypothetical protein [Halodesulfovibrio sp.]
MADYLGQTTDIILGQEFLTWLWFRSEVTNGNFTSKEGRPYNLYVEQRVSVQGGEGETLETATVSGSTSELKEARLGLSMGKKVTRALIRIEQDTEAWQLTLKAEDFSLGSLKTPKVEKADANEEDDVDGPFLEKIFLIESCLTLVDDAYRSFLETRLSNDWKETVQRMGQWLSNSE